MSCLSLLRIKGIKTVFNHPNLNKVKQKSELPQEKKYTLNFTSKYSSKLAK